MPQTIPKDPESILDFSINYTNDLQTGETISTSTWSVPTGITKVTDTESNTATTIWLSGGTLGTKYTLKNVIVTNSNPTRTHVRRIHIPIVEL